MRERKMLTYYGVYESLEERRLMPPKARIRR
jgi:hypothetical protein